MPVSLIVGEQSVAGGVTLIWCPDRQPRRYGSATGTVEQEWLEVVRGLCRSVGEIIGVDTAYLENTASGRLQEGLDSLEEKYSAGNAFPVYAVCAVVHGAGRISGDVFDRFGAAGEKTMTVL